MKKYVLIVFILIFTVYSRTVYATSGYLKSNSIVTCNGIKYGQHGDGHWHKAEFDGKRWHAVGSPISSNPCIVVKSTTTTKESTTITSSIKNIVSTTRTTTSSLITSEVADRVTMSTTKSIKIKDENDSEGSSVDGLVGIIAISGIVGGGLAVATNRKRRL